MFSNPTQLNPIINLREMSLLSYLEFRYCYIDGVTEESGAPLARDVSIIMGS